jgi:hypothetical protein
MIDLYCGRGGWTRGFMEQGFECHGYDVEDFSGTYPGVFHRMDARHIDAAKIRAEFGTRLAVMCASSPCDEFARFTMPWTRAKNPPEPKLGVELAQTAFHLADATNVPLIFENVRSAQRWLGRAVMHCGPFYLWGSGVPALIPIGVRRRAKESYGSKEKAKRAEIPLDLAGAFARFYAAQVAL